MVRIILFVFVANLFSITLFAQEGERDLLYLFDGKKAGLYLTSAPEYDEQIYILRKRSGSASYDTLNLNNPLQRLKTDAEVQEALGGDKEMLMNYLDADDESSLARGIMGNSIRASFATLIFPSAAIAAGRLFYDSTVTAGAGYDYQIIYMNESGDVTGEFSKSVTAVSSQPASPSGLTGKVTGTLVNLQWQYPKWESDRTNFAVRFFVYKKVQGQFQRLEHPLIARNDEAPGSFQEAITGNDAEAEYYVTAADPLGNESKPSPAVKVKLLSDELPSPPTGLTATVQTTTIQLVWNISAEPNVQGYNVYRRDSPRSEAVKINKQLLGTGSPFFTDSTMQAGISYNYFVTAVSKANKESKYSGMATAELVDLTPPEPPTALKTSFSGDFVRIEWKASRSGDTKEYNIYRSEDREAFAKVGSSTGTSFIDSGYGGKPLTPGFYYHYTITATDKFELEGKGSDTVLVRYVDRVPPPAPSPMKALLLENKKIEVRVGMTPVKDLAKVTIFRRTVNGKDEVVATNNTLPFTFIDEKGKLLETYIYTAQSADSSGNVSPKSETEPITLRDMYAPGAVPFVSAVVLKTGGTELAWVAVVEADLAGYNIYRSDLPSGTYEKINASPVKTAGYKDASGNSNHFYKIKAVDTSGNESEFSPYAAAEVPPEKAPEPKSPDEPFQDGGNE